MIPLWKGKNPIYFGVITILPFDNLYRRAYFVMHTFLVFIIKIICLKHNIVYFIVEKSINDRRSNIMLYILKS
jgi:hypothetical protein